MLPSFATNKKNGYNITNENVIENNDNKFEHIVMENNDNKNYN